MRRERFVPAYKARQQYREQMASLAATQAACEAMARDAERAANAAETAKRLVETWEMDGAPQPRVL